MNITRDGILLLGNTLGQAWEAVKTPLGNTNQQPAALLELEAALCLLRIATLEHNDDSAAPFLKFNSQDTVGFGLENAAIIGQSATCLDFPAFSYVSSNSTLQSWNPSYDGPPCPQGWIYWQYGAWKTWSVADHPYNPLGSETEIEYATRDNINHPTRWNGSTHVRVPLYEFSRYISVINNGQVFDSTYGLVVFLGADDIAGWKSEDHVTATPLDVQFYYHPRLVQGGDGTLGGWDTLILPLYEDTLTPLSYEIFQVDVDSWVYVINLPSDIISTWTTGLWWHIAMYYGSRDTAQFPTNTFTDVSQYYEAPSTGQILWPRKNFFRKNISNNVVVNPLGLFDGPYLVSKNETNYFEFDGQYSSPIDPVKYSLFSGWPQAPYNGVYSSLTGYLNDIDSGCAVCVVLAAKNMGTAYEASLDLQVLVGPQITPEFFPSDWDHCNYFPKVPAQYNELARLVLQRNVGNYGLVQATQDNNNLVDGVGNADSTSTPPNILSTYGIGWMKQTAPTFAYPPIGDANLAYCILAPLQKYVAELRTIYSKNPITKASYLSMVPALGVSSTLAPNINAMLPSTSYASIVFRSFLKNPINPLLENTTGEGPAALIFKDGANAMLQELCGLAPSTELMRLESDKLFTIPRILPVASNLELFMEPSSQCFAVNNSPAGTQLGQDYTLRMVLRDSNDNLFQKDLYIMNSSYFVSNYTYEQMLASGLDTSGYYMTGTAAQQAAQAPGTLQSIPEFYTYGYAGLIPDFSMGQSRTILTRQVDPPKDTNQYPNEWVALVDTGLAVTTYSENSVSYWTVDLHVGDYFDTSVPDISLPDPSLARADSFTIAPSSSLPQYLESYGKQAVALSDSNLNHTSGYEGEDKPFYGEQVAFLITSGSNSSITDFTLRMKMFFHDGQTSIANPSDVVKIYLYADYIDSNSNHVPGALLATGGQIAFSQFRTTYDLVSFPISYNLGATNYWIVLKKPNDIVNATLMYDSTATPHNVIKQEDYNGVFHAEGANPWLQVFSDSHSLQINQIGSPGIDVPVLYRRIAFSIITENSVVFNEVSVQIKALFDSGKNTLANPAGTGMKVEIWSDNAGLPGALIGSGGKILFSSLSSSYQTLTVTVSAAVTISTYYWVVLTLDADPLDGRLLVNGFAAPVGNILYYDGSNFVSDYGNPYLAFHNQTASIIGAFNRDSSNVLNYLPGPNNCRVTSGVYEIEGWWAYTCKTFDSPTAISAFPRAINVSGTWQYVRFENDVYGVARLVRNGVVSDVYFHFERYDVSTNSGNPSPISLGIADSICFLGVGKTLEELQTYTHGAPPGDRLVLRST